MNIVVFCKLVPDLVEELTIDPSGTAIDTAWLRLIINEFDDYAIEQAILLKEAYGGQVTVISLNGDGVDDMLFAASARGADRLIRLNGDFESNVNNHGIARILTPMVKELQPDMILTGVQAHNDLDGPLGSLLAEYLDIPYVGYIAGVKSDDSKAVVRKEYPGGLVAEMEVSLPAVLGIQAAEQPPRYVAISKVRQAMKTAVIEENDVDGLDTSGGASISRMFQPEATQRATMIEGGDDDVADKLVSLFKELGVL
jgi:electron transfer flavoprotein beta subunit